MFSFPYMPSTTSVLSTYTTLAALLMLLNTAIRQLQNIFNRFVPKTLQDKIISKLEFFMGTLSSTMCIIVNETNGYSNNEVFEAAEIFLSTRISPSVNQFQVFKVAKDENIMITIEKGEEIIDNFDGIELKWKLVCLGGSHKTKSDRAFAPCENSESRLFQLRFNKEFKEKILNSYLPFVLEISKEIKEQSKVVKLHSLGCPGGKGSVNLNHPSTFHTLAMDPMVKKELIEDLDRFVKRKDFYRRVGKAWKRGYLLYGPPGTGKSSLVAAMANHLKFDIYDLVLGSQGNSDMRRLLTYTKNRSIIVIEDIDCSTDLENREDGRHLTVKEQQLNLSGLLNFIDGLWSSCGDQRIIVFTTNYKERLDPALLRPGRMDMHIHMSYCTFSGFKILASNYLEIKSHRKFDEIERMIDKVEVTPAEIAEELMKSEGVEIALDKVVELLCKKRDQSIREIKGAIEDDTGEEDEKGAMEKMCSVGTNNNMQVQALQHVIN